MAGRIIDLRSDTVTQPTPAMRRAIAEAAVGDDVFADDPTVNELEARMARWFGREAAVFNCSGTQSNQMAIRAHCQIGDQALIEEWGHIATYEGGGAAALSGVSLKTIRGEGGLLDLPQLEGLIRPKAFHYSPTRLLCVENSTNHGGGRIWPLAQFQRVAAWAHANGLQVHLDGARLFNAAIAGGYKAEEFAAHADTISICFSKGLGCPMGSILIGTADKMDRARYARKQLGGGLRQSGMLAAAALHALDHHLERLADDHLHARLFAEAIVDCPGISLDLASVETNLVFFHVDSSLGTAADIAKSLSTNRGIRVLALGPQRLRAVTHLDVNRDDILQAAAAVRDEISARRGSTASGINSPSASTPPATTTTGTATY